MSAGFDKKLKLWDLQTYEVLSELLDPILDYRLIEDFLAYEPTKGEIIVTG